MVQALRSIRISGAPLCLWLLLGLLAGLCLPSRAAEPQAHPLDLTEAANMGFRDRTAGDRKGGWTDQGGNDFRHMPVGRQDLCGVPFRITDPAGNDGRSCVVLRGHDRDYFPRSVTVPVGRKAAAVAFLHTLGWGDEKPVARYVVRYADGESVEAPIRAGKEILGWWGRRETEEVKVAVTGHNLATRQVSVHAWAWRNPRPEVEITSLELRSTDSGAVPIIVAATALDAVPELHSELPEREASPEGFTMIEAEDFDTYNVPPQKAVTDEKGNETGEMTYDTWPDPRFSGGDLFLISPPGGARNPVDTEKPQYLKDGALKLTYSFTADRTDTYTLWARVGPAEVYSPFRWRIDEGKWGEITREDPFLDMWHISFWYTVGWLKLGERELQAGEHVLHLEVPRPTGDLTADEAAIEREFDDLVPDPVFGGEGRGEGKKSKKKRWMLGVDCFAVSSVRWHPCGRLKPGQRFKNKPWLDRPARTDVVNLSGERFGQSVARKRFWLDGVWQIARDQEPIPSPHEDEPEKLRGPLREIPPPIQLHWRAANVPHTEKSSFVDMLHQRWYRRYFSLPADMHGRRLSLHFGEANYTASVFVNGRLCGTHFGGYVPFGIDITEAVEPDKLNEIMIAVKGLAFYRRDYLPQAEGMNQLWHRQMLVPGRTGWHKPNRDGIPGSVWLETHGQVVTQHPFVQSDFSEREVTVSVELDNRSGQARSGEVRFSVLEPDGGEIVAELGSAEFDLAAGEESEVAVTGSAGALDPWFPGRPRLYRIRAEVVDSGGAALDRIEDTFGFREVELRGKNIYINDRRFNFGSVITGGEESLEATLGEWEEYNCNTLRLPHGGWNRFFERERQRATLDFTDREGIAVRMNSQINGMFIDLATNNDRFWENAAHYYRQFIKAYRNHPSIIIWTAENELDLISNMAGRRWFKRREWEMIHSAHDIDPSRPTMADGAGDLMGKLPICNWHYCEVGPIADPNDPGAVQRRRETGVAAVYQENAYTFERLPGRNCRQRPWDRQRPLWAGETYFYSGQVQWQGWIGGDRALAGRFAANRASVRFCNMLCRGYRWQDVAGYNLFTPTEKLPGEKIKRSLAPVAVFSRDYHRNHYAGRTIQRRLKIFNDTLEDSPITLEWTLELDGEVRDSGESTHEIEPGENEPLTLEVDAPEVAERANGTLRFVLQRDGGVVFEESHPMSVFPARPELDLPEGTELLVLDPDGEVGAALENWGVGVRRVRRFPESAESGQILIVGSDALGREMRGAFRELNEWVQAGGRALVLEQNRRYPEKALPFPLKNRAAEGSMAFPRGEHSALEGVKGRDLCIWGRDQVVFLWPFRRSRDWPLLVDAGVREGMDLAPVVESRWGRGHYVLCQLLVGENLGEEPMADRLLAGFLNYLAALPARPTVVGSFLPRESAESALIRGMGYAVERHSLSGGGSIELEVALSEENGVVALPGTRRAIRALQETRGDLEGFTREGGWVLLCGIEKDALGALSKLVGAKLIYRPVRQERIVVLRRDDPLMAGIGNHEFYWIQKMDKETAIEARFLHGDRPLRSNVFTGTILYEDICGLARHGSVSNHLTSEDHWKYISYRGDTLELNWRRPFEIHKVVVRENRHYKRMLEITLTFGDGAEQLIREVPGEKQPVVFEFPPREARSITLKATKFERTKPAGPFGWDTVEIFRTLSDSFRRRVVPLTRPAGVVKFPMGRGGIVLNMTSLEHKKGERVLMQLLHNLGAARAREGGRVRSMLIDEPPAEGEGGEDLLELDF